MSVWQRAAVALVLRRLGPGSCTVEQYRLLTVAQKPIDIVVEQCSLFIEVDGQQHAASSTSFGEATGAQCERDKQFERGVLASGGRLLRLHWADVGNWATWLEAALRRCRQPGSSFVYYSASYPPGRRVA